MPQQVRTFPNPAVATDISITVPSIGGTNISCTTNGNATLTSSAAFGNVFPGMAISGTGIQPGTTVLSIASPSSLTMSLVATDSTGPSNRSFSYALPFWFLKAMHIKLTTDANVATRAPRFIVDDGTNPVMSVADPGQIATVVADYHFMGGATLPAIATTAQTTRIFPIADPPYLLKPGWRIRTSGAYQAGDQFSEIVLVVDEFAADITPAYMLGAR